MSINQIEEERSNAAAPAEDSNEKLQSLDDMLVETARDWSQYLQVDTTKHDTAIQDVSEDLMIRLDEFQQLLSMSKEETGICFFRQLPTIQEKYHELEYVFENIDNLKMMVNRIKSDMDRLDKELTEAEPTVETAPLQSLVPSLIGGAKTFLGSSAASVLIRNSIRHSENSSSSASLDSNAPYEPIDIFRTENFFDDSLT